MVHKIDNFYNKSFLTVRLINKNNKKKNDIEQKNGKRKKKFYKKRY